MLVVLKVLTDLYAKPDKLGKQKLIKKNLEYLKQFESNNITVEQYLNAKGTPSTKWCLIRSNEEYYRVNHKFNDLVRLTTPIVIKGFRK